MVFERANAKTAANTVSGRRGVGTWSDFVFWVAGIYVLVVPNFATYPGTGLYNEKRLLQVGLLLIMAGTILLSKTARRRWMSVLWRLPFAARLGLGIVLALGVVSSVPAPAPEYALLEVGHVFLLFVLAGVVASVVRQSSWRTEAILLGIMTVSVLLYVVQFAVGYTMHLTMASIDLWPKEYVGFGNLRHFNQYQTWTLPLLAVPVLTLPERWRLLRGGVFGLLSVWWMLVIASNVRGTVLALVVAVVGVGLLFRRQAWKWIVVQVAALLGGIGLYYVLFSSSMAGAPPVVDKLEGGAYFQRIEHWLICLEMAVSNPWLGAGPMHYAWPPINFLPAAHPHNALMQWLGEWGIPSTALMSGLTIWGGWSWMRQEKAKAETESMRSNALRVALVASVLAGAAHAMVSGVIVMPVSQVLFALIGGWAWGRYQHNGDASSSASSFRVQAALCVVLVAAIGVVGNSLRDLATVQERRSAFLEAVDRNRLSPRYWTQGYLNVQDPDVIERARLDF